MLRIAADHPKTLGIPMRTSSRHMPPLRTAGPLGLVLALGLVGGLVTWVAYAWWPGAVGLAVVCTWGWIAGFRRAQRIARERSGESICGFARAFDCRVTDPWVIRATYEGLSSTCGYPVRAADRFEDDLSIGTEDLDFEAINIADRSGRSLEHVDDNPLFDRVKTVRDLVMFLNHQPDLQLSAGSGDAQLS